MDEKAIRTEIREIRAEMRRLGIKRSSFMNGGHSPQSYMMNARLFELETHLKRLKAPATS